MTKTRDVALGIAIGAAMGVTIGAAMERGRDSRAIGIRGAGSRTVWWVVTGLGLAVLLAGLAVFVLLSGR